MSSSAPSLRCLVCGALALLIASSFAAPASASPWTLAKDELSLSLSYDFQSASQEYLPSGEQQSLPLDGEFDSSATNLNGRYGFTPRFEGFFGLTFKQVSYASRPLLNAFPRAQPIEQTRRDILNFSDTTTGAGDLILGGRYNLVKKWWLSTVEVQAKVPTGYDAPTGTTVALGDGIVELQPSILFGAYLDKTSTFLRADLGYNARFGAGHQAVGGLKAGQFVTRTFIIFAGANTALTLFQGEPLDGETNFIAINPDKPFDEFDGDDIREAPLYLDRSFLRAEVGVIFRLKNIELQIAYSTIPWGKNIPVLHGINISSVLNLEDVTAPD